MRTIDGEKAMQQLIKQLADQAGFIRFSPDEDPHTPIDWSSDYSCELNVFAELIVKECAKFAQQTVEYSDIRVMPYVTVEKEILEHFGVE